MCEIRKDAVTGIMSPKVLQQAPKSDSTSNWRLPGHAIEATIAQGTMRMLSDHKSLTSILHQSKIGVDRFPAILAQAQVFYQKLSNDTDRTEALDILIERVELKQDGLKITISLSSLIGKHSVSSPAILMAREIDMRMKRRGVELRLVIGNTELARTDRLLIKTIAQAHEWWQELRASPKTTLSQIAAREKADLGNVSRIMNLAFLAPDIIEAIMVGKQPADLTAQMLLRHTELPLDWPEQRRLLGFA